MKLSFKNILPILLIFTLLILFAGCAVVPDDQPGYTPGTITGIIAAPCCSTSAGVANGDTDSPEYWCYDCKNTWSLQDGVKVILTYGEDEVATVLTNEDGEYTFTNVPPGKNYVITALCPDYDDDRPLVKDVALEVVEGETYDAKITDCVSTSLGLVVDFLVTYSELGPEDIVLDGVIAGKPNFWGFPRFKKLVEEVCRAEGECVNLNTDEDVQDALCKAAEEIGRKVLPDLDLGCAPGFAGGEGGYTPLVVNYTLTLLSDPVEGASSLTGAGTYAEGTQDVAVNTAANPCYEFTGWTVDVGTPGWVTGDLNTEPLEVDMNGNVTLTAHFACPPCDEELDISIISPLAAFTKNTLPDVSICVLGCATIDSVTVNGECGDVFPLVLIPPYDPSVLSFGYDTDNISFDYGSGEVCFIGDETLPYIATIDVTYTNPCGTEAAKGTVYVEFKDCSDPCAGNVAPIIDTIDDDKVVAGADFDYDVTVTDPDVPAQTLTYSIAVTSVAKPKNAPSITKDGADDKKAHIDWTSVDSADIGKTFEFIVTVDDGCLVVDPEVFHLEVTDPCAGNTAPSFTSTPVTTAVGGANYSYDADATDPDVGDTLTYAKGTNWPGWLDMDANGLISGTAPCCTKSRCDDPPPTCSFDVDVEVSDECTTVTQSFTIKVTESNEHSPEITSVTLTITQSGSTWTYSGQVNAHDDDAYGFITKYEKISGPGELVIDATTGELSGSTTSDPWIRHTGDYDYHVHVKVKVTDNGCTPKTYEHEFRIDKPHS